MKNDEDEARRTFVVEIDAILSELLVINGVGAAVQEQAQVDERERKLRALRCYVLEIFDKRPRDSRHEV